MFCDELQSPVATKLCQCGYQFSSRARLVVQSPEKADKIHSLKGLCDAILLAIKFIFYF